MSTNNLKRDFAASKAKLRALKRESVRPSRFRLLPLTMIMATLMLSVKVNDIYVGSLKVREIIEFRKAYAEEAAAENEEDAQEEAEAEEGKGPEDIEMASLEEEPMPEAGGEPRREFSQVELDILQSLAQRREELEDRDNELDLKEKLLEATELRINDKLDEMKRLEEEVSLLLEDYNKQEQSQIKSLVKIYENMKPKDAAQIFNELDMPILLEVIDQMSERKAAPILAQMSPIKAKEVTADLAEMRKLNPVPRSLDGTR